MLWREPTVDGIKTGMTDAAGYCLVSSAKRGDMRLISVLLGTSSDKARADATQALLNWGFRFYESHRIYGAGQAVTTARVWKGESDELELGLAEDLWVTLPRGRYEMVQASLELQSPLVAPVAPETSVGRLRHTLEGEALADLPLFPLASVAEGGLLTRAIDSIQLWLE